MIWSFRGRNFGGSNCVVLNNCRMGNPDFPIQALLLMLVSRVLSLFVTRYSSSPLLEALDDSRRSLAFCDRVNRTSSVKIMQMIGGKTATTIAHITSLYLLLVSSSHIEFTGENHIHHGLIRCYSSHSDRIVDGVCGDIGNTPIQLIQ